MDQWSVESQKLTVELFTNLSFHPGPDGIGMKHVDGRFGFIELNDAIDHHVIIHDRENGVPERFKSIEEAVKAGWVID